MLVRPPVKAKGLDRDVLKEIESWRGLPIARRYFNHLNREAVEDTLAKLARQGSLVRYPPLVEDEGVMVAQYEHSIYLGPQGVEVLTGLDGISARGTEPEDFVELRDEGARLDPPSLYDDQLRRRLERGERLWPLGP